MSDDTDTHVDLRPQPLARRTPDPRVPRRELRHRDAVGVRDGLAAFVLLDKVESVTVGYHTRLRGRGRCYPVSGSAGGSGGSDGSRSGCSGGAGYSHACCQRMVSLAYLDTR